MDKRFKLAIACLLLVVSALFFCMVAVVDVQAIGPNNTEVGLAGLNKMVFDKLGTNFTVYKITEYAGYLALLTCPCFALLGLLQLIKRKSLRKVDGQIYLVACLYVVVGMIYVFFEKIVVNYRPVIVPGETELEASFPSSHTLMALTVLVSAVILLKDYIKSKPVRLILSVGLSGLAAVIVIGRLISGVHWITDIIASVLFSVTLLAFFSYAVTAVREGKTEVPDYPALPEN